MARLMRCLYCGLLQDEPAGVKECSRCGGELVFEQPQPPDSRTYVQAQMELDQITAPAGQPVERHLVVTVRTPAEPPRGESAPTQAGRAPLSFVAVLDVSGSMRGEKMERAKDAVRQATRLLHDGDVFALVAFASAVETVLPPMQVDGTLRQRVDAALTDLQAGGQTALCGGLEAGIAALRGGQRDTSLVLLLSDGQANVGEIDLEKVGARALEASRAGITVSTLGVGTDYNEALMAEIATQGGGRFYHVQRAQQIVPYVAGELGEASALLARGAVLHLQLPAGASLNPLSAAYRVTGAGQVWIGDIPADTTLEIVLQLRVSGQPAGSRLSVDGHLSYRSPAGSELSTVLNTVTLRYVEAGGFAFRDGVVAPVVKRVLEQMRATGVLRTARARAASGARAQVSKTAQESVAEVQHYASLLGEEEARAEAAGYERVLADMAAEPAAAKFAVASAHGAQRGTKHFGKP